MWISQLLVYLPMAGTSQVTQVHALAEPYLSLGTQLCGQVGREVGTEALSSRASAGALLSLSFSQTRLDGRECSDPSEDHQGECAHLSYKGTEAHR